MDNQNLPAEKPTTDILGKDAEDVKAFTEAGMPNIGAIQPDSMIRMYDMYLNGKGYKQIADITRVSKVSIMYLSTRHNWFEKRQIYLEDLEANNKKRMHDTTLTGQEFMMEYIQAEQRRMQAHIRSYVATGDEKHLDKINGKNLDRWLKAFEMMQKGMGDNKPKAPLVSVNVGNEGATLTRTGENTVEVTPKQKAVGAMLKELADAKRRERGDL